jgi:hypothetical protein
MFFVDGAVGTEHPTCLIETYIDDVALVFTGMTILKSKHISI